MAIILSEGQETTFEDLIGFFHSVSKAEYYLYQLSNKNRNMYLKLKHEASSLPEDDFLDSIIFDCAFVEEPRVIRFVLTTADLSKTDSSFDQAKKNIVGYKLSYWRDFLRGEVAIAPDKYFTYLNFFTRFAARTGKGVDVKALGNLEYLEGQFLRERMLAKALTFNHTTVGKIYTMEVSRTGDLEEISLESRNATLRDKISSLQGGEDNEGQR